MRKTLALVFLVFLFTVQLMNVYGIQRFPKPEFESGYVQPETLMPNPRAEVLAILDIAVLVISLSVVSWLVMAFSGCRCLHWLTLDSTAKDVFVR